jgi:hypothetical protein
MILKFKADSSIFALIRGHTFLGTLSLSHLFKIHAPDRFIHFSTPIQAMIRRYGAPSTSSIVGSHHALFSQGNGLIKQPAAPRHPPTIEIVAAGFLRLIHEQTVILLKAITPAASANSRHAMYHRQSIPISGTERAVSIFLPCNRNLNRWWNAGRAGVVDPATRHKCWSRR